MANFCDYHIVVKGCKKATLFLYNTIPALDYKEIVKESGTDEKYALEFNGNCKWSVNFDCKEKPGLKIDYNAYTKEQLYSGELSSLYWDVTLRQKSELLNVEIMVHYWSEESNFDKFDHYKDGKCIKRRKIFFYPPELDDANVDDMSDDEEAEYWDNLSDGNEFDWKTLEFVGHEGEYNEAVTGEEDDIKAMNRLFGIFGLFN